VTNDPAAEALLALLDYSLAHPNQQQLGGPGGHPVLRLLLSRLQDGSAPGARGDGFKLGLVVEGGGMRGCGLTAQWPTGVPAAVAAAVL
jgi:hypothetical protein